MNEEDAAATPPDRRGWGGVVLALVFAFFYAYDLWEAIGNFVNLPVFYAAFGIDAGLIPWWLLVAGILIPPVVFAVAVLLGRGWPLLVRALVLLAGLAVVAALGLGVIALEQVLRP